MGLVPQNLSVANHIKECIMLKEKKEDIKIIVKGLGRYQTHLHWKEHLRIISYWLQRKFNVQKALVENNLTITIFDLRWGFSL